MDRHRSTGQQSDQIQPKPGLSRRTFLRPSTGLIGSDASAEMDPAYSYTGLRLRVGRTVEQRDVVQEFAIDTGDQFAMEPDHMAQCIKANRHPHTPGEEGLQDMRIIEAIYQSAREGRPVRLTQPGGPVRGPEPEDAA